MSGVGEDNDGGCCGLAWIMSGVWHQREGGERKGGRDLRLGHTPHIFTGGYPRASLHFHSYWEPLQHCGPQGDFSLRVSHEA